MKDLTTALQKRWKSGRASHEGEVHRLTRATNIQPCGNLKVPSMYRIDGYHSIPTGKLHAHSVFKNLI